MPLLLTHVSPPLHTSIHVHMHIAPPIPLLDPRTPRPISYQSHAKGDKQRVVGLLLIKDLAGVGFERQLPLATLLATLGGRERLHVAEPGMRLDEALRKCQRERCHMLVVSSSGAAAQNSSAASDGISAVAAAGVVTMEDLLEEILQQVIHTSLSRHPAPCTLTRKEEIRHLAPIQSSSPHPVSAKSPFLHLRPVTHRQP